MPVVARGELLAGARGLIQPHREELGNLGLTEKGEEAIVAFMNPMKNNPYWMSRFLNPEGG